MINFKILKVYFDYNLLIYENGLSVNVIIRSRLQRQGTLKGERLKFITVV